MTTQLERLMSPAQEVAYLNAIADDNDPAFLPTCPSCGCAVLADGDLCPPCGLEHDEAMAECDARRGLRRMGTAAALHALAILDAARQPAPGDDPRT
jgi:hypothetical protein